MTDELEKLQRKGTKPTCPHCHATVLSTSQPNLMGTTPELQKMYDEFGGENLPNPETMLAYASILEKPQYHVDKNGRKWLLATGEIIEAACAALRRCAALAATPAVGGEARDKIAAIVGGQHYADFEEDACGCSQCEAEREACRKLADQAIALAAPPASPLRGREIEQLREWKSAILEKCKHCDGFDSLEWGGDKEGWGFIHYFIGHLNTRALSASPPEQPAALPLAVRLRDEAGPPLPQMIAQRREQLSQEQPAAARPAFCGTADSECHHPACSCARWEGMPAADPLQSL